jgi:hypothetical protein
LVNDLPKKIAKIAEIFGLFSSKYQITTRGELSPQHPKEFEVMDNFNPAERIT